MMQDDELLPVINEEGEFIKLAPRKVCHDGKSMLLHPVIHLHILNSDGHLFLQKRSMNKDIQAGKWDTSVGGHVDPGETIEQALHREAREEAGLVSFTYELIRKYLWESEREREMVYSFITRTDQAPVTDPGEVDDGRYWPVAEIEKNLGKGVFTPNFEYEYLQFLKTL
ncbi:MAG: NUDIX domain-containing protein [Bacteroidales bacterium]|jgi:isopentenyldiphosphate isomerase|nr:NUDIX domain-containing protein [Bacteroidales bacterium]